VVLDLLAVEDVARVASALRESHGSGDGERYTLVGGSEHEVATEVRLVDACCVRLPDARDRIARP
jgi:hypothetical protein